jgi:uncharacterized protein (TIGR00730 family)
MKNICVYCGSQVGLHPQYQASVQAFADLLVQNNICVVYGGGNVGLMGVLAETMLEKGGEVIGVIPRFLVEWEVAHNGLTELRIVESMHERKQMMADLSEAFVVLPGGIGTLEELFEVFTWRNLELHQKPIGILNVEGYYDSLIAFLENGVKQKFLKAETLDLLIIDTEPESLLKTLLSKSPKKEFDRDKI